MERLRGCAVFGGLSALSAAPLVLDIRRRSPGRFLFFAGLFIGFRKFRFFDFGKYEFSAFSQNYHSPNSPPSRCRSFRPGGRYVPPVKRKVSPAAGFSLFVLCSTVPDRRRFIRRLSSRPGLGHMLSALPACAFVPSLLSALRQVCCRISEPSAARMVYL